MGKKRIKILSSILTVATLFGGSMGTVPASAATNSDALYKNAYDSVIKARGDKTQQSITAARKAIAQLSKENDLKGFVGEFSKQVDGVQQKLFDEFYSLLFKNGKKKDKASQAEVNKAREYVKAFDTYEGNKYYTASWSSAVDAFQQKLIVEAHEAVVKAMKSKNAKDIGVAENLVKVIGGSTNKQTLDKSKELNAILKALKNNKGNSNEKYVVDVTIVGNTCRNYRLTQSQVNQLRSQKGQYSNTPVINYLNSKGFNYNPNLNKNAQCYFNNDRAGMANTDYKYSKLKAQIKSKLYYIPDNNIISSINESLNSFANECKSEGYTDFGVYSYLYEDNGVFYVKGSIIFGKKK